MRARSRRAVAVAAVAVVVAAVAIAGRIAAVNADAFSVPERRYEVGDQVDLGGSFFAEALEKTDGYALRVTRAEVMDADAYLARYGRPGEGAAIDTSRDEPGSVLCLTYEVRNEGAEEGGILLIEHQVVASERNCAYRVDGELLEAAYPQLAGQMGFSLLPDTSFEVHVPFSAQRDPGYLQTYDKAYRGAIAEGPWALILANAPERLVVDVVPYPRSA